MDTGKEFLKKHIDETNIPAEHWENEIGEMMDWYADYYYQAKLKELTTPEERGEELLDFIQWRKQVAVDDLTDKEIVDFYLVRKTK